jgi:hypothetical protein
VAVATLEDGIKSSLFRSGDASTVEGGCVESLSLTDLATVSFCLSAMAAAPVHWSFGD